MACPRILFVVPLPPPYAGVEQMSLNLLQSNLKNDFDLKILKSNIRTENRQKGHWDISGVIKVLFVAVKLFLKVLLQRPKFVYLIISQNPSGLMRDCLFISIASLQGVKVVGQLHGSLLAQFIAAQNGPMRGFYLFWLRRLSRLVVLGESIKSGLMRYFSPGQISVLANGIPSDAFLRSDLPKNKSAFLTVCFMGHLTAAKGFFDLIRVAQFLLPQYPNVKFVFAGEKIQQETNIPSSIVKENLGNWELVESLARKYPERLVFSGIVVAETKRRFFEEADIFILPSYSECFSMAILEAMAARAAVILTPVGAHCEIFTGGEDCLMVQPGNIEELRGALERLIGAPDFRNKIALNGEATARNYSMENIADRFRSLFTQVIYSRP